MRNINILRKCFSRERRKEYNRWECGTPDSDTEKYGLESKEANEMNESVVRDSRES